MKGLRVALVPLVVTVGCAWLGGPDSPARPLEIGDGRHLNDIIEQDVFRALPR